MSKASKGSIDAADISAKRVLAEYARIAFASLAPFLRIEDGQVVVDISVATKNDLALLANVKQDRWVQGSGDNAKTMTRTRLKLHDKLRALEALAKHFDLFKDHSATDPQDAARQIRDALVAMTQADEGARSRANRVRCT